MSTSNEAGRSEGGVAAKFQAALQECEQSRDVERLAVLFADGAELGNLGADHTNDAREFWRRYLGQFRDVRSEFTGEMGGPDGAALEWVSRGTLQNGRPIEYRGISVLRFQDGAITQFHTYYDSAAFVTSRTGAQST